MKAKSNESGAVFSPRRFWGVFRCAQTTEHLINNDSACVHMYVNGHNSVCRCSGACCLRLVLVFFLCLFFHSVLVSSVVSTSATMSKNSSPK